MPWICGKVASEVHVGEVFVEILQRNGKQNSMINCSVKFYAKKWQTQKKITSCEFLCQIAVTLCSIASQVI